MTLDDIKTGDIVAVSDNHGIVKAQITRTTKTLIIINGAKYSRRTGRKQNENEWNPCYVKSLSESVEKEIAEYQTKRNRENLIISIQNADFDKVPTEILKQIKDLLISSTRR
jgi:predicted butyrate kinase (DUF1464 family)